VRTIVAAAIAFFLTSAGLGKAEDWPTRALTMVVPYAAGGPVDTIGRILAARLSEILGQQVVIENAGGGAQNAGISGQVRSERDRAMGRPDQGKRSECRLTACVPPSRGSSPDRDYSADGHGHGHG
jgi:hypothetical protein